MNSRTGAVTAAAIAIALAAAGCGGGDEASAPATVTQTVTAAAAPAATTTTATVAATETTAPAPSAATGALTPGGTKLKMGQTATIVYEDGGNGQKATIAVTPEKIEKGTLDDFKNIDLDADQKKSTPYYVTVRAKNVGKTTLRKADPASYIDAVDDRGQEQTNVIFFGDFDRCPSADSRKLAPGDGYETCLTYLVPGGGSIEGMRWTFFDEKNSKSNVDWK